MANVLFDFDLSSFGVAPSTYQPYVGGGAGYVWNEIRNARFSIGGSNYKIDDTDPQFAYQAILGSAFGLGGVVPGLSLTAEYRFLGTLDPKFNLTRTSGPAVPGVPGTFEPSNVNHSLLFGLRYAYNPPAAPAAPAAAAAPVPARTSRMAFFSSASSLGSRAIRVRRSNSGMVLVKTWNSSSAIARISGSVAASAIITARSWASARARRTAPIASAIGVSSAYSLDSRA